MATEIPDPGLVGKRKPESVIVIKPRILTPKEQQIQESWRFAHNKLGNGLAQAITLAEFILNYYAQRLHGQQRSIEWMWDLGEPPTQEQVLESYLHEGFQKEAKRDAGVVEELRPVVDNLEERPDGIKIALKRIREGSHGFYKYGILAQFPRGIQAESPILGSTPLEQTQIHPDTVFFRPTAACVLHAVDDLFKEYRRGGFYIPYKTRGQALADLQYDDRRVNEYMLKKTPEEVLKQEAANYMLVGLHSAFSNEPYVVPVSRFWAR